MVVRQSTKGTSATTAPNSSGARLTTAPISMPPADPPRAASRSGVVKPRVTRWRAQAMKSVKVCGLADSFPSSYHCRPSSPPPRTWAMAKTKPRSSSERRKEEKAGSTHCS